jgi:hypothetical protein
MLLCCFAKCQFSVADNPIMLRVVMPNVIMINVVAPNKLAINWPYPQILDLAKNSLLLSLPRVSDEEKPFNKIDTWSHIHNASFFITYEWAK